MSKLKIVKIIKLNNHWDLYFDTTSYICFQREYKQNYEQFESEKTQSETKKKHNKLKYNIFSFIFISFFFFYAFGNSF